MKTDPDDPDVGKVRWLVKHNTNGNPAFYYADGCKDLPSPEPGLKRRGVGDLHSAATDEIAERVDLEEHVGEVVATVTVDVDAWDYRIDWEVDVEDAATTTLGRLIRYARTHAGWRES